MPEVGEVYDLWVRDYPWLEWQLFYRSVVIERVEGSRVWFWHGRAQGRCCVDTGNLCWEFRKQGGDKC